MGLRLIGYACPKCGQDEALLVKTTQWAFMTCEDADDGPEFEEYGSYDGPWGYDDDSRMVCPECDWQGELRDCIVRSSAGPSAP